VSDPRPARPHTKWSFTLLFGVGGALIVALIVLAFVWPTTTASAKNLPVAISGPAAQVTAVENGIAEASADLIDFDVVDDRASAVTAIEERDVYGAIVLGEQPEVLIASASNASATAILRNLAAQLQVQAQVAAAGGDASQVAITVTDVVPLNDRDPNGSGLIAASFPLVLGGMLGGILISLLVVGVARRLTALAVYAVVAGTLVATIMQGLFGVLQGPFLLNALALALSMLATSSLIVGFTALIGPRGIAIGSVISMLIGNPLAGSTVPWQFLAEPWGAIGQFFVPGAASALVRELSYFPSADSTMQWLVLIGWTVAGVLFSTLGHFRSRAPIALPANELEAA
jgi:energy-converting hydrogenase Eha subunit B